MPINNVTRTRRSDPPTRSGESLWLPARLPTGRGLARLSRSRRTPRLAAHCKISSHTFICEGVTIEDDVFVGHGVVFIQRPFSPRRRRRRRIADGGRLGGHPHMHQAGGLAGQRQRHHVRGHGRRECDGRRGGGGHPRCSGSCGGKRLPGAPLRRGPPTASWGPKPGGVGYGASCRGGVRILGAKPRSQLLGDEGRRGRRRVRSPAASLPAGASALSGRQGHNKLRRSLERCRHRCRRDCHAG